ncbi:unnamed protein product [Prorocentrum cordatum]|uniref:Uncharacterized protein n=1 Tax=Prorocentrum cordatum TaxID=2364126 RepID=A0ABN9PXM8_9DINO|nr:unnamed protein product [Polarella glacialis]
MLLEARAKRDPDALACDQGAERVRVQAKTAVSATRARCGTDAEATPKRQGVISAVEREIAELERNEEGPDVFESELQDAWEDLLTPEREMEFEGDELTRLLCVLGTVKKGREDATTFAGMSLQVGSGRRNCALKHLAWQRPGRSAPSQEDAWIEPPPEWPNPNDEVWHLRCTPIWTAGGNS